MQIAASNPKFASKVHYKLSYDVRVVAEGGVKAIESASHGGIVQVDLEASPPSARIGEEGAELTTLNPKP